MDVDRSSAVYSLGFAQRWGGLSFFVAVSLFLLGGYITMASRSENKQVPVQLGEGLELWTQGCSEEVEIRKKCSQEHFDFVLSDIVAERKRFSRAVPHEMQLGQRRAVFLGMHRARKIVLVPPIGVLRLPPKVSQSSRALERALLEYEASTSEAF
ncbi:MAG: hypothetical protein GY822_32305 [Deltaproteobacteria bacterium]|nr:hypothetical protein [Deltaproteobacteria bacterium]